MLICPLLLFITICNFIKLIADTCKKSYLKTVSLDNRYIYIITVFNTLMKMPKFMIYFFMVLLVIVSIIIIINLYNLIIVQNIYQLLAYEPEFTLGYIVGDLTIGLLSFLGIRRCWNKLKT